MFIPPRRAPVRLLSDCGRVWTYISLLAFIKEHGLDWITRSVGPHFRVSVRVDEGFGERIDRYYPFILRNEADEIVSAEDCRKAWYAAFPRRSHWVPRYAYWNGRGPVPGTGKLRGRYFRAIRTFGSHRAAAGVEREEGEPTFRPARDADLPSAWDDRAVAARRDRSWKRFRRTRWKSTRG